MRGISNLRLCGLSTTITQRGRLWLKGEDYSHFPHDERKSTTCFSFTYLPGVQTFGSSIFPVQFVLLALMQPNLEEVFGSASRVRVLQSIVEAGEIHITSLSRKTKMNHSSISRQVEVLKELGLIEEERYAGIRMFRPAFDSMVVVFRKAHETRVKVTPISLVEEEEPG